MPRETHPNYKEQFEKRTHKKALHTNLNSD